jgi:hypothetical protein
MPIEIIENTREAQEQYGYLWGANDVVINKEQLEALLNGKCLATNDGEYVTFIMLEQTE